MIGTTLILDVHVQSHVTRRRRRRRCGHRRRLAGRRRFVEVVGAVVGAVGEVGQIVPVVLVERRVVHVILLIAAVGRRSGVLMVS